MNNENNNNNNNNNNRKKPNYFIGLRVNNKEIQSNLETIVNTLKLKYESIIGSESFVLKERYHLTVLVMTLNNENDIIESEELNKVKTLFKDTVNKFYNEIYNQPEEETVIKIQVNGLSTFNGTVLYASLKEDKDKLLLSKFVNSIRDQFIINSIKISDSEYKWTPHITLAKGLSIKPMLTDPLIEQQYSDMDFGTQQFLSIDLLKIGSKDNGNTGYYHIIDSIKFN